VVNQRGKANLRLTAKCLVIENQKGIIPLAFNKNNEINRPKWRGIILPRPLPLNILETVSLNILNGID